MIRIMIVDDHPLMRHLVRELLSQEHDMEMVAEACNGSEAEMLATQTQPDVVLMALELPDDGDDGFEATERVKACSPQSRIIIMTTAYLGQDLFHALKSGVVGYITRDSEPETFIQAIRSAFRDDLYLPHSIACHVIAQVRALVHMRDAYQRSMHHENQQNQSGQGGQSGYQSEQKATSQVSQQHLLRAVSSSSSAAYRIAPHKTAQAVALVETPEQQATASTRPLTEREQEILSLVRRGRKNREIAGELNIAESTVHKHVQNIFEKLHARNRAEAIYLTSAAN